MIEVLENVGRRRYGDPMNVPTAEELAKSQADLNEYLAYIIMGESFNELRYVECALDALANHNLAAGFEAEFAGKKPPDDLDGRQRRARACGECCAFDGHHEQMGCGTRPARR
jgi:hypothetical protein